MLSEKNKFDMLLAVVRHGGMQVRIKIRELPKRSDRKEIDGAAWYTENKIFLALPPVMNENQWSEAASVLAHEYGHCVGYCESERGAWKNADRLLKNFPLLVPRLYAVIKICDLEAYKQIKTGGEVTRMPFKY